MAMPTQRLIIMGFQLAGEALVSGCGLSFPGPLRLAPSARVVELQGWTLGRVIASCRYLGGSSGAFVRSGGCGHRRIRRTVCSRTAWRLSVRFCSRRALPSSDLDRLVEE